MAWTPETERDLRRLWARGDTATMIGIALHCSRNAVLGKVHRLKLEARAPDGGPGGKPRTEPKAVKAGQPAAVRALVDPAGDKGRAGRRHGPPKGRKPANNFGFFGKPAAAPLPPRLDLVEAEPTRSGAIPIDDAIGGQCHWPLWGSVPVADLPPSERLVCAAPARVICEGEGGKILDIYCEAHRSRASAPGKPVRLGPPPLPRDMADGGHTSTRRGAL
ncbi:GcrA cell cycle regulator [Kaistia soli DSM 19436]|uniref:GcrA cell cycle regulator n=1 Tax=Kaistia soli DSM 19436 TaxID=1122133 RepID=A0A1M4Y7W1_9HYPH|nr:GcrA family cell cycle regulator [Kaistia soli]SHF01663.1 GcrA cell cycle regulator [Kaistia soli DSM 19436]